MVELLRTNLFFPRPRKNLAARRRLVDCLNEGLDKKLTLIAALTGFGKTTLLSEWIPQSLRSVAWLSLDNNDNDPTKFWAYFIRFLQGFPKELGEGAFSLLQSSQALPITSVLTTLVIDHQPVNKHLMITTRMDPPLPLARLRAREQLTELRANDMRFTVDETAAFLNRVMGLNLSSEEVPALEARTEGWIAGLQIAALSMQGHDGVPAFCEHFPTVIVTLSVFGLKKYSTKEG